MCVGAGYAAFTRPAHSGLRIAVVVSRAEKGGKTLSVRMENTGGTPVRVLLTNLDCRLFVPPGAPESAALHLRPEPAAGAPFRIDRERTAEIEPGKAILLAGLEPLLHRLPPGVKTLSAVYRTPAALPDDSGVWKGTVRSFPVRLAAAGE